MIQNGRGLSASALAEVDGVVAFAHYPEPGCLARRQELGFGRKEGKMDSTSLTSPALALWKTREQKALPSGAQWVAICVLRHL